MSHATYIRGYHGSGTIFMASGPPDVLREGHAKVGNRAETHNGAGGGCQEISDGIGELSKSCCECVTRPGAIERAQSGRRETTMQPISSEPLGLHSCPFRNERGASTTGGIFMGILASSVRSVPILVKAAAWAAWVIEPDASPRLTTDEGVGMGQPFSTWNNVLAVEPSGER
ncbi:hypothetical protein ACJZ2D_003830 [Fusarium nematophilum]